MEEEDKEELPQVNHGVLHRYVVLPTCVLGVKTGKEVNQDVPQDTNRQIAEYHHMNPGLSLEQYENGNDEVVECNEKDVPYQNVVLKGVMAYE